MNKLKLEDLEVESFVIAEDAAGEGTVNAHSMMTDGVECGAESGDPELCESDYAAITGPRCVSRVRTWCMSCYSDPYCC